MLCWSTGINKADYKIINIKNEATDDVSIEKCIINGHNGEMLPCVKIIPKKWDGNKIHLILGKENVNTTEIDELTNKNIAVITGDLFMTGEFKDASRLNEGHRFFPTFNYTTDAYRAQDAALFINVAKDMGKDVTVKAYEGVADAVICAAAVCDGIASATIERKTKERQFTVPGILAMGGMEGILKLVKCKIEFN